MRADHTICPNHGFAIARRIRQISPGARLTTKPAIGHRGEPSVAEA
jgi:hypothetical protein